MTEKTTFREHIAKSGGVCPRHSNQYTDITSQTSQTFQTSFDADMRPRRRRRVVRRSEATEPRSGRKRPRNQTLVKTVTGLWQVTYNGENRPVRWTQGDTVITMSFDRMGRRVTKNAQRFVYNGYLQIAGFHASVSTQHVNSFFTWDPTERVATRPLVWRRGTTAAYYTHDGNKNVSEVVDADGALAAHYEYAPFGALTVSRGASAAANPWRFSSEYADKDVACCYFNFRHFDLLGGRWISFDRYDWYASVVAVLPYRKFFERNLYCFVNNDVLDRKDYLGLMTEGESYSVTKGGFLGFFADKCGILKVEKMRRSPTCQDLQKMN